jgi:hypothetical protein
VAWLAGLVIVLATGCTGPAPAVKAVIEVDQRLASHADPHPHALLAYPAADHNVGWLAPDQPGTVIGDALGKADAWPRLLSLLGA